VNSKTFATLTWCPGRKKTQNSAMLLKNLKSLIFFILYGILVFFLKGHYSFADNQKSHLDTHKEECVGLRPIDQWASLCPGLRGTAPPQIFNGCHLRDVPTNTGQILQASFPCILRNPWPQVPTQVLWNPLRISNRIAWNTVGRVSMSTIMTSFSPKPHNCQQILLAPSSRQIQDLPTSSHWRPPSARGHGHFLLGTTRTPYLLSLPLTVYFQNSSWNDPFQKIMSLFFF